MSFSPPPPAHVSVVPQPKSRPIKKEEPKCIPISTSKAIKNDKVFGAYA